MFKTNIYYKINNRIFKFKINELSIFNFNAQKVICRNLDRLDYT